MVVTVFDGNVPSLKEPHDRMGPRLAGWQNGWLAGSLAGWGHAVMCWWLPMCGQTPKAGNDQKLCRSVTLVNSSEVGWLHAKEG